MVPLVTESIRMSIQWYHSCAAAISGMTWPMLTAPGRILEIAGFLPGLGL